MALSNMLDVMFRDAGATKYVQFKTRNHSIA
jgi:hypothetical protein